MLGTGCPDRHALLLTASPIAHRRWRIPPAKAGSFDAPKPPFAGLTSPFPKTAKTRYLVRYPFEALYPGAQSRVFGAEDQRHDGQVFDDLLLGLRVELFARRDVVFRAGLVKQGVDPLTPVFCRIRKALAVEQDIEE